MVSPRINGQYLVTAPWGPTDELARVFDSTGRFVRILGHSGAGPNEYRRPEYIHRIGDSALIYDSGLGRVTVLRPPDTVGSSRPWLNRPHSFLALADGSFILSTGSWSPGNVLRHVDASGSTLAAFGDSVTWERPGFQSAHLASSGDGGFWSAPHQRLQFDLWTRPGVRARTVRLEREWFQPYDEPALLSPTNPPSPYLLGFWVGRENDLWIVVRVADSTWWTGLGPEGRAEGRPYFPVVTPDEVYDTRIERVDLATGVTTASILMEDAIIQVVEPWILASADVDGDGWYRAQLWVVRR